MRKLHWLWLYLATERPRVLLVGFGMQHRCRDKRARSSTPISALNSWFVGGS